MRQILSLFILFFAGFVCSENVDMSDPNNVIHSVANNTFARLEADRDRLSQDSNYIDTVIEEELIPYFDYKYTAYKVIGTHLRKTSKTQRDNFVNAFKAYLILAYGHILLEYDQQKVSIINNNHFSDKKIVSIAVNMRDKNDKLTQLVFKLRKNKKTLQWKVFDVIAEGISMLATKQAELNELIQKKGINHVIEQLQKKNSELAS